MQGQQIQPATVDKCTLLIQLLHEGVTKELLYKEFKKCGEIKSLKHFQKTKSAQIQFDTPEEAASAKRMMNHSEILSKEINIVNYQSKDDLKQKKKFNLFIKNVPEDLETKVLHNFMQSEYGDIASLMLKKNEKNQNLGYGYVQFESKKAYESILEHHSKDGKITVKNSTFSFNIEQFNDSNKNKQNTIHIQGLFEDEVTSEQQQSKNEYICQAFDEVKNSLGLKHFSFHTQYNESKRNFWVNFDFQYNNEEEEELVYQKVKQVVKEKFSYKNSTNGPIISFKSMESSEKNLILLGIKKSVNEKQIADWIKSAINVEVSAENIKIKNKTPKTNANIANPQANVNTEDTYYCTVFFDSKKDGELLMIFCAKRQNATEINQIFEIKHKVTLFLKKSELEEIKKQTTKMSEYTSSNNLSQGNRTSYEVNQPQPNNFMFPFNAYMPNNMMPRSFPQGNNQIPRQNKQQQQQPATLQEKNQPLTAPKTLPPPQQNIFLKFVHASLDEKKSNIEKIAQSIQTEKAEFDKIDEINQKGILGQIIYYKISNLDVEKNPQITSHLEIKDPVSAKAKIEEFKTQVAKITGMLIDLDVFTISDIIEIVKDEKELIERCSEAIDLINQKN